jgi:Sec-independent protein secretion pathway component TatC
VTMVIAMAPLVILFELSVMLARIFERRRERAAALEAEEDDEDEHDGHEDDDAHPIGRDADKDAVS